MVWAGKGCGLGRVRGVVWARYWVWFWPGKGVVSPGKGRGMCGGRVDLQMT